jgi:hypothetical protein
MAYKVYIRIESSQSLDRGGFDHVYDVDTGTGESSLFYESLVHLPNYDSSSDSGGDRILVGNALYAVGIGSSDGSAKLYLYKSDDGLVWSELSELTSTENLYAAIRRRTINGCRAGYTNYFVHNFNFNTANISLNGGESFDYSVDLTPYNSTFNRNEYYITPRYLYAFVGPNKILRYSIDNLTASPVITYLDIGNLYEYYSTYIHGKYFGYSLPKLITIKPSMGNTTESGSDDLIYVMTTRYFSSSQRQANGYDTGIDYYSSDPQVRGYYPILLSSRDSGQTFTEYRLPYEFFEHVISALPSSRNLTSSDPYFINDDTSARFCINGENILIGGRGKYAFSSDNGTTWIIGDIGYNSKTPDKPYTSSVVDMITQGSTSFEFFISVHYPKDLYSNNNNDGDIYKLDFTNATSSADVVIEAFTSNSDLGIVNRTFNRATALIGLQPSTNLPPNNITLSSTTIIENNEINQTIGTLTAPDPELDDVIFSIVSGSEKFNIASNTLQASTVFDYEIATSHDVTIRATDAEGATFDKTFTILVQNQDEAPENILLSNASLQENNTIGYVIGTLSVVDTEVDTVIYTLVSGYGDNASFSIEGDSLKAAVVFNYELKNSYSIKVAATDVSNNVTEKIFQISVTNVNEGPVDIRLSGTNLVENNEINQLVGTLTSNDPEGGTVSYSLVSGGDKFNLSVNNGITQLKTSVVFDYDEAISHTIVVRATNSLNISTDASFTVNILPFIEEELIDLGQDSFVSLDNGLVYAELAYDPQLYVVRANGTPLQAGAVVINTNTKQKYVKLSGDAKRYYKIPLNAKTDWNWSDEGNEIWLLL